MTAKLIVTTGDNVDGARVVEYLGVVRGLVVRVPAGAEAAAVATLVAALRAAAC